MPPWLTESAAPKRAERRRPETLVVSAAPGSGGAGKFAATAVDPELREYVREWRRIAAKEQNVPAYLVMHDASLEELCSKRPRSIAQLLRVSGFGERKAAKYGEQILAALERFRQGRRAAPLAEKNSSPAAETLCWLREGRSFEEIARMRGRQVSTVISAVVGLVESGELEVQSGWVAKERQALIAAACARVGVERLRALKDALPPEITFQELRLVVARVRWEKASAPKATA
jgi:ATP-dependent DNA helicase RecQ